MVELGDLLLVVMDVMLVLVVQVTTVVVAVGVTLTEEMAVEVEDTKVDLDLTLYLTLMDIQEIIKHLHHRQVAVLIIHLESLWEDLQAIIMVQVMITVDMEK